MNRFIIPALIVVLATPALASNTAMARMAAKVNGAGDCVMKETVTVGINFTMQAASMAEAKAKYDEKLQQIGKFAQEHQIKTEPQSLNYNIYAQNNNNDKTYQISGNINYQMDSTDAAFKFADFLDRQKYNVNLNSNAYRQGNCQQ